MMIHQRNEPTFCKSLIESNDRPFLQRTVQHGVASGQISRDLADQIQDQAVQISHKLITMQATDFGAVGMQKEIERGVRSLSVGLEYAANQDLHKATRLLIKNPLVKFFQIGNTLIGQLQDLAMKTVKSCRLTPPAEAMETEPICVYNAYESKFLEVLAAGEMTIGRADAALTALSPHPWVISCLADIEIANHQIDNLNLRFDYLRALPQSQIFSIKQELDAKIDPAKQITSALIANLILFQVVDFDNTALEELCVMEQNTEASLLEEDEDIADEIRAQLSEWIKTLFDNQSEAVRDYIRQYWQFCWKQICLE